MLRQSPAAIKHAVTDSVRWRRFARITVQLPLAQPTDPDCGIPPRPDGGGNTIVLDARMHLGTLLRRYLATVYSAPAWGSDCRVWLTSAIADG